MCSPVNKPAPAGIDSALSMKVPPLIETETRAVSPNARNDQALACRKCAGPLNGSVLQFGAFQFLLGLRSRALLSVNQAENVAPRSVMTDNERSNDIGTASVFGGTKAPPTPKNATINPLVNIPFGDLFKYHLAAPRWLPNGLAMSRNRRGPSPLLATKPRRADCRLHCRVRQ